MSFFSGGGSVRLLFLTSYVNLDILSWILGTAISRFACYHLKNIWRTNRNAFQHSSRYSSLQQWLSETWLPKSRPFSIFMFMVSLVAAKLTLLKTAENPNHIKKSSLYKSGQIIIFHQPRFPWNSRGFPLLSHHHLGVNRSCEVAIIWPDKYGDFPSFFPLVLRAFLLAEKSRLFQLHRPTGNCWAPPHRNHL